MAIPRVMMKDETSKVVSRAAAGGAETGNGWETGGVGGLGCGGVGGIKLTLPGGSGGVSAPGGGGGLSSV